MRIGDGLTGVLRDEVLNVVGVIAHNGVCGHCKEHIRDAHIFDEADEVALQIAHVGNVDLLKGIRIERNLRVTEAVLNDEQLAAVFHLRIDFYDAGVAAEELEVRVCGVHIGKEVVFVLVVKRSIVVGSHVVRGRHEVVEIVRVVQNTRILRETVHSAYIARNGFFRVGGKVCERHACGLGKRAGGIVGASCLPVVVGAQVNIFLRMLFHYVHNVYGLNAGIQLFGNAVKAFFLVANIINAVFRGVDGGSGGRGHRPNGHTAADLALQVVECIGVSGAATAAEGLHAAPVIIPVYNKQVVHPFQCAVILGAEIAAHFFIRSAHGREHTPCGVLQQVCVVWHGAVCGCGRLGVIVCGRSIGVICAVRLGLCGADR